MPELMTILRLLDLDFLKKYYRNWFFCYGFRVIYPTISEKYLGDFLQGTLSPVHPGKCMLLMGYL